MNNSSVCEGEKRPCPTLLQRWRNACLLCFLLGAVCFLGFCLYIDSYGHRDQAQSAQVIIVLGARVEANGTPGDSLTARTRQAVELYRMHIAPKIIFTGGLGQTPPSEAEAAAALAGRMGVPEKDILLESKSTSTRENAAFSARICKTHGWTRAVVVSDPYHLWRAKRNFTAVGITAYTSPALQCEREQQLHLRVLWVAREGIAILRDLTAEVADSLLARM